MKIRRRFLVLVIAALVLFSGTRIGLALRQVQQSVSASSLAVMALGTTKTLRITPVFEAWVRSNEYQSGHGVSYLIQTDLATVLLDLGNNEQRVDPTPLHHNMTQLSEDVSHIDAIVISHNHPDHVGGMTWWRKGSFDANLHGEAEGTPVVYLPQKLTHPSLETIVATESIEIAPGVAILGRQPFLETFPFMLWNPLGWEQAVVVNVEGKGLVIIMGCGHPSMERIILKAEAQFALPVIGVFGGLHYGNASDEQLKPDIDFLAQRNPELVALSPHDSSGGVLQAFESAFPGAYRYITVGSPIEYPHKSH